MRICYSFASRSRPERFLQALKNIEVMSASKDFFVVAKLDEDDEHMNTPGVISHLATIPYLQVKWGYSKSKIDAINRDIPLEGWDILICMSDDIRFNTYGFDDIIRAHMPANLDGFLHAYDDYAKADVCTVSIIGRTYYQRDGYIYNGSYYSLWADNEETDKSKERKCYVHVPGIEILHLHYSNHMAAEPTIKDPLYRRNDTYHQDKQIYDYRKQAGWPK